MLRPLPLRAMSLLLALPLFVVTPAPAAPCSALPVRQEERESLQEFLDRLRKKQAALFATLGEKVNRLLTDLEQALENNDAREVVRLRTELVALGPEAAPLLVEAIEPGRTPERKPRQRAQIVALALREMPSGSITSRLLELAEQGSKNAQQNALGILGQSRETARVSPVLIRIYTTHTGEVQVSALRAIAELGGEEGDGILRTALTGVDDELRQAALDSIITARAPQFAEQVLRMTQNSEKSAGFASKLLAYWSACPDVVEKPHVAAILGLADDQRVDTTQRVAALELLRRFEKLVDSRLKRQIKDLAKAPRRAVSQAALIFLAISGDSNARRDLLAPYDEEIERTDDNSARAFHDRGVVLYEIQEYSQAFRDFKEAIKLARDEPRSLEEAHVYAARCNARLGKLKLASDYLQDAPISTQQLQNLAYEADFEELRNSRYGKVFRLPEEE